MTELHERTNGQADRARERILAKKGSIISAAEGDAEAAQRGKAMARVLIEQYRPISAN